MIQPKKTQSKRDHVDKQREEGGESAILSSVAYCCASVFMVLANKTLVTTFKFRHFLLLVCMQNALSLVSMLTLKLLGVVKLDCSVQPQTAISWSPVNVFFLLMLFTGSASLHGLPLSVVTIFKNTTNIIEFWKLIIFGLTRNLSVALPSANPREKGRLNPLVLQAERAGSGPAPTRSCKRPPNVKVHRNF